METNSTTSVRNVGNIDFSLSTTVVYITFGLLGISGNGLVLLVIARVKELRDITNILIANQSLLDLISSVLLIAMFVVPQPPIPSNPVLARFVCGFWYTQYPYWSTYSSSIFNLTVLTLERYLAVVHPLQYRRKASNRLAGLSVLIPWMVGFIYMSYLVKITRVEDGVCARFIWPNYFSQQAVGIATFVIVFLCPLGLMTLLYIPILKTLRKDPCSATDDGTSAVHQKVNYRDRARRNTIRMMICLTICFCICLSPNCILYFIYCLGVDVDLGGVLYYVTVCVAFINIWINPLVYALQYHKFQRGLKLAFECSRCNTTMTV